MQDTQDIHDDDLDTPLWGAKVMAPVINRTERYLIETKQIDVTKKGALYVSTRRRLLASLGVQTGITKQQEVA